MENKFLVIDNDYSRISGSTKFIHDELDKIIKYDLVWDEKWSKSIDYDKKIFIFYDNIIFIHSFLPLNEILKLKNKNIIWIPMFDSLFNLNQLNIFFWKSIKLLNIKIISFSELITRKCIDHNIEILTLKYFLKTSENINYNLNKLNILFWDRGELQIKDWLNYFNKNDVARITIIQRPDPRKKPSYISQKDKIDYNVEVKKIGYIEKSKYNEYLFSHNVYISPRFREGIGIAYLEALSYGMFIVGINAPTMNEYLKDSKIGKIIKIGDKQDPKLNLKEIIENQKYRINFNSENFINFKEKILNLKDFLFSRKEIKNHNFKIKIYIQLYQYIYNFLFFIKRILIRIKII